MQEDKTDTELKLRDAETQLELALRHTAEEEIMRSCINAFISHARSVTFAMQKESASCPSLQKWYEGQKADFSKNPLFKFCNEQRVYSIHKGVIKPEKETMEIWNVKVNDTPLPGPGAMTILTFDGAEKYLPGRSGNVFRMCKEYYTILHHLVAEWLYLRQTKQDEGHDDKTHN